MKEVRVMIAGPSGIGKTTLANSISKHLGIPFISGSIETIFPETKEMTQREMNLGDHKELFNEEIRYLVGRSRIFENAKGSFITDRSFLDNYVFSLLKTSVGVATCDTEQLEYLYKAAFERCSITHLIVMPFYRKWHSKWTFEDNHKRTTNKYYQTLVSDTMVEESKNNIVLRGFIPRTHFKTSDNYEMKYLELDTLCKTERFKRVIKFLDYQKLTDETV